MSEAQPRRVPLSQTEIASLVSRYGLHRAGARPTLAQYTRDLWRRREFVFTFATARNEVGYSASFLGQAWQLLTPMFNAAVYYFVFGLLLHTSRGVSNFIAFLVIGVFAFNYTQTSVMDGSRSISKNLGLTRALHFPRAVLPVSSTLEALEKFLYSLIIMVIVVLLTGEPVSAQWVLAVFAIALQSMFNLGLAFTMARIGAKIPDISQILPFAIRAWLYMSGVFYSTDRIAANLGGWVKIALDLNPGSIYMNLIRDALLTGNTAPAYEWPLAFGWAVVALVLGYVFFWKEEESYGTV